MKNICCTALVLLLFLPSAATSQDAGAMPAWSIGISAGGQYTMSSGGFAFPAAHEPEIAYDDASGIGPAFGVRVDIPLSRTLAISPRLFAECRTGVFTSAPFSMTIIGMDLQPQEMRLEDELDVVHRVGGLDLLVTWRPTGGGWYLAAGPSIGMTLYENFIVTERILEPAGVTFLDGSTAREMYDDDPGMTRSLQLGVRAGAGVQVALNEDMALGFEALYLVPFQTVAEDTDWSAPGVLGSLSLVFLL